MPVIFLLLLRNLTRVDFTVLTWLYLVFITIGYYVLALFILISVVFLIGFWSRNFALGTGAVFLTLFIFYLLIDGQTYSLTSIHINTFWLEWIWNDLKGLGLPPSTIPYALLALFIIAVLEFIILLLSKRIRKPRHIVLPLWSLAIVSLIAGQLMHIITYENNDIRITSLTPHLPIYIPITSHSNAVRLGNIILPDKADSSILPDDFKGALNYPLSEIRLTPPADKRLPNIVLIFLESWRFDMLNKQVTPNIYELSQKSTTSLNHFCSGNSTVAGTFGLFYGLNPTYWMAVKSNNVIIDNPVLIDVLKKHGYQFGIFAKSNFKRHKLKDTIFRGIDIFEDFDGRTILEQDKDLTDRFNKFLDDNKDSNNPLFGFAFYKSNHAPYLYPKEDSIFLPAADQNLLLTTKDTDPTNYLNDYRNATHYVDRLIGEIIDKIKSSGMMSNTIIILTTDHGEEFNDNRSNFWGHGSNFTGYQTIVPLVFYAPDKKPNFLTHPTAHIDIAPTLLNEFLYCENQISDYSNGTNIFADNPAENRPFVIGSYVNIAYIMEDNVFEIYPIYTKEYKLMDIRTPAGAPSFEMLKEIVDESGRFYKKPDEIN